MMKHSIATIFLCAAFTTSVAAQSASEKAEKRLAEMLAPGSAGSTATSQQMQWKAGKSVAVGELPIMPYAGLPIRLPTTPGKDVKPGHAPEGAPLLVYQDRTTVPVQPELPTKALIRLPSVDVNAPLPIPILAKPSVDRASLADPAFEASVDAAMKRFTPARDKPLPFTPMNLPDPFEYLRYGQLRHPPEESSTPPAMILTKPK